MPKKTSKTPRTLSTYELIDWSCPVYLEAKPGSTDQSGVILEVRGLTNGLYIWNVVYIRERFPDGRRADWQLGVRGMNRLPVVDERLPFEAALTKARELMAETALPVWR